MMSKQRDLNLKFGSKEESAWDGIRKKVLQVIEESKRELIINEEILKLADKKVKEAKDLYK